MGNCRESSRQNFTSANSAEDINIGSLQRIADACELMAKDRHQMIAERDEAMKGRTYWRERAERADRQLAAARGQITKLRNRIERAQNARLAETLGNE